MSVVGLAFIALNVAAGSFDLATYRIPNFIVGAIGLLFLVVALFHLHDISWANHLTAAGLCLFLGFVLSFSGIMGAGDAKLISVLALWSGLSALIPMMLFISIAGVVILLLVLLARAIWPRLRAARNYSADPRILRKGEGIPYGVAIAIGAIAAMSFFPAWIW